MQGCEYGMGSQRPSRLKNSIFRPLSQHRSSSMSHQDSLKKTASSKLQTNRQSMQLATSNEYYVQEGVNATKKPFRESCQSNRPPSIRSSREDVQNLEKTRKFFIQRLQRWMMELREQIHRQSTQIFSLQRIIENQSKEIEAKGGIIRVLIAKLQSQTQTQRVQNGIEEYPSGAWKRIQDLQAKLGVIVSQIEEEKGEVNQKLEQLTNRLIKYFGKEVWKLKGSIFQFMKEKGKQVEEITTTVKTLGTNIGEKLNGMEKNIESVRETVREAVRILTEQSCSKDNASITTNSKDTISLTSHRTDSMEVKKEDSMFSDYFFYPSEKDMPTVRIIEQLVKDREELPIRVFTDSSGRLKYWQSRTFLFDRKGNFAVPSSGELAVLEQRGWIKLIAD